MNAKEAWMAQTEQLLTGFMVLTILTTFSIQESYGPLYLERREDGAGDGNIASQNLGRYPCIFDAF